MGGTLDRTAAYGETGSLCRRRVWESRRAFKIDVSRGYFLPTEYNRMPNSPPQTPQATPALNVSGSTWTDASGLELDLSAHRVVVPTLLDVSSGPGYVVTTTQGQDASGNEVTETVFVGDVEDVSIKEDLLQVVEKYYDNEKDASCATVAVLTQIKEYAAEIQCSDFQGKGTIDDYSTLFQAASKIANDSKQMQLSVDVEGFTEFGDAAEQLSKLFTSFIVKLENVSVVNDLAFLQAIASALSKIVNLSNVFGRFKKTILAKATIELPKSAHDATLLVKGVMSQMSCAMNYINYFVDPSSVASKPADSELSAVEKNVISKAVSTIDQWNILCDQNITIAMANNTDIQYVAAASADLKVKAAALLANKTALQNKLALFNLF